MTVRKATAILSWEFDFMPRFLRESEILSEVIQFAKFLCLKRSVRIKKLSLKMYRKVSNARRWTQKKRKALGLPLSNELRVLQTVKSY